MSTPTATARFTGKQIPAGSNAIRKAGHSKRGPLQPTAHVRHNKEDLPILTVNIQPGSEARREQITIKDHAVAAAVEDQEVQHPAVVEAREEAVVPGEADEEVEVAAAGVDTRNPIMDWLQKLT
jgi:hypothetical protein